MSKIDHLELRWRSVYNSGAASPWSYTILAPDARSFDLGHVIGGATYEIQVRAVNIHGVCSDWGAATHVVAGTGLVVLGPTNVTVIGVADGVNITWTISGRTPGNTQFEISRAPDVAGAPGVWVVLGTSKALSWHDGVIDGGLYWYRVRALAYTGDASVYTQAAAAAKAKTSADGADISANITPLEVLNPFFENGDTYWTKQAGWTIANDIANVLSGSWLAKFACTFGSGKLTNQNLIPVQAAQELAARAYVKSLAATGTITVGIEYLDSTQASITIDWQTSEMTPAGAVAYTPVQKLQSIAPSNAVFCRLAVRVTGGTTGTWLVDNTYMFLGPATSTLAGKDLQNITALIGGGNSLRNSSFENVVVPLDQWTKTDPTATIIGTADTAQEKSGQFALKLVNTTTNEDGYFFQRFNRMKPNTKYTFSAWAFLQSIAGVALNSRAIYISDGTISAEDDTLTLAHALSAWVRHRITFTTSASPSFVECRLYAPNGTVFWDDVQLEEGDVMTAYSPNPVDYLPQTIDSSTQTNLPNDNIFPNGGSENLPPDGANLTRPEWAARANVGALNAVAGTWVRQLAGVVGTPQKSGDKASSGMAANQSTLGLRLPCAPGDPFYIEALARAGATNNGTDNMGVWTWFLDSTGAVIGGATTSVLIHSNTSGYTKVSASGAAPSNCVAVILGCFCDCASGATTAWFDSIYARKQIARSIFTFDALQTSNYSEDVSGNPTAGAKLDSIGTSLKLAGGNLQIGTFKFDGVTNANFWARLKNALAENNAGTKFFYRGNAAGPIVNDNLSIIHQAIDLYTTTRGQRTIFDVRIQLVSAEDFGGATHIRFTFKNHATGGGILFCPRPAGFDTPAFVDGTYWWGGLFSMPGNFLSGTSNLLLLCDVQVYSTLGANAATTFDCNVAEGVQWPINVAGGGGGGGGGGSCPAPWVKIELASGLLIPAADFQDGMKVVGFDIVGGDLVPRIGTVRTPTLQWNDRFDIYFSDGSKTAFSRYHRLVDSKGWKMVGSALHKHKSDARVQQSIFLRVGDVIPRRGMSDGVITQIVPTGRQQVVDFKVEGCQTYFADGIASHNNLKP